MTLLFILTSSFATITKTRDGLSNQSTKSSIIQNMAFLKIDRLKTVSLLTVDWVRSIGSCTRLLNVCNRHHTLASLSGAIANWCPRRSGGEVSNEDRLVTGKPKRLQPHSIMLQYKRFCNELSYQSFIPCGENIWTGRRYNQVVLWRHALFWFHSKTL
jgi:hypothetical protein